MDRPASQHSAGDTPEVKQGQHSAAQRERPERIFTRTEDRRGGLLGEQETDRRHLRVVERLEELYRRPFEDVASERGFVQPERAVGQILAQPKCDPHQDERQDEPLRAHGNVRGGFGFGGRWRGFRWPAGCWAWPSRHGSSLIGGRRSAIQIDDRRPMVKTAVGCPARRRVRQATGGVSSGEARLRRARLYTIAPSPDARRSNEAGSGIGFSVNAPKSENASPRPPTTGSSGVGLGS